MTNLLYPSVKQSPLSMSGMGGLSGSMTFAQSVYEKGGSNFYDGNDVTTISGSGVGALDWGTGQFCIECYLKLMDTVFPSNYEGLWHRWGSTSNLAQCHTYKFGANNYGIQVWMYGNAGTDIMFTLENLFTYQQWHHIAFCRHDTGTNGFRVYVDGTMKYENTLNAQQTSGTTEPLTWGGRDDTTSYDGDYYISNARWTVGNDVYDKGTSITVPNRMLTVVSGTKFLGLQSTTDANAGTSPANTTISTKRGSPTPSDENPFDTF